MLSHIMVTRPSPHFWRQRHDGTHNPGRSAYPVPGRAHDGADGWRLAEFERAMIRERTSAGLAAARAEGRVGGRREKLDPGKRKEIAESVISGHKNRC
jgi:hypothetical protein